MFIKNAFAFSSDGECFDVGVSPDSVLADFKAKTGITVNHTIGIMVRLLLK